MGFIWSAPLRGGSTLETDPLETHISALTLSSSEVCEELIVKGQPFRLTLNIAESFWYQWPWEYTVGDNQCSTG